MRKKYLIIGAVIFALGVLGVWAYFSTNPPVERDLIADIDRKLTKEEEGLYKDRIRQAESFLKGLNPDQPGYGQQVAAAHLDIGHQYFGLGRLSRAKSEYEKALETDPSNYQAHISLSQLQIEIGNYIAGRISLEKAKDIAPGTPDIWLRYITLTKDMFPENRQDVETYYKQAMEATGRHPDILSSYAQYLEAEGRLDEARDAWKQAADKVPNNPLYRQEYVRLGGK